MSHLPLTTIGSIPGVIKDHSSTNPDFAHFLMDETIFKDTFQETLQLINVNLKRKGLKGCVVFGRFCDHDGTHITLWMDSERKPGSAASIKNFVDRKGEFKPWGVQFLKTGNNVILIAKGSEILSQNYLL